MNVSYQKAAEKTHKTDGNENAQSIEPTRPEATASRENQRRRGVGTSSDCGLLSTGAQVNRRLEYDVVDGSCIQVWEKEQTE